MCASDSIYCNRKGWKQPKCLSVKDFKYIMVNIYKGKVCTMKKIEAALNALLCLPANT